MLPEFCLSFLYRKAKNGEYCLYWILYQRFVVSLHLKELFDSKTPQNAENRTVS